MSTEYINKHHPMLNYFDLFLFTEADFRRDVLKKTLKYFPLWRCITWQPLRIRDDERSCLMLQLFFGFAPSNGYDFFQRGIGPKQWILKTPKMHPMSQPFW